MVWSPLGWARLTGKIRRGQPLPKQSRLHTKVVVDNGPQVSDEYLFKVVDAIDEVAKETGKTVPQIAMNWLLQRPTVSSIIIGRETKSNCGRTSASSDGICRRHRSRNWMLPALRRRFILTGIRRLSASVFRFRRANDFASFPSRRIVILSVLVKDLGRPNAVRHRDLAIRSDGGLSCW